MPPPKDVVKIAIQMVGAIPQLIELQQTKPLASVLKDVCDAWSLPNAERYALQYADGRQTYITESNRGEIKNGSILRLTTSPDQEAERLYSGIQSNNSDVKTDSLKKLASLSQDVTFAQEFINRNGLKQIFYIVEEGNDTGEMLAHTLKAFIELMEHDFVSWETLSAAFIKKIVSYVNINAVDASVQQLSLSILENMVPTSHFLFELVKKEVTLDRLLTHLQVTNAQLQLKAMALLVALLLAATDAERRDMMDYLREKNIRQFIHKNIIHSSEPLGDEMAHYLYVLQSVSLNLCERRMRTSMDPYSQEQRELLQSLRQTAFESESEAPASNFSTERRRSLCAKEFRKLGFMNNSNPAEDLRRAPPGLLALDNMVYFSRHTPNAYSRFVLENSSREDKHECPFARSSIQLTLILCEILHVGEPCSETAQAFYPMFFGQDHFFEELFCICIQLVNKTWKEMRATQEDFDKVLQVVREQITRTLSLKPTSLELFKTRVNALNYSEILKLRQTERLHQEETLAVPVLELRERLKPELLELIRQQRLLHLCEGTLFRKISSRRRQDKLWYCRLSPNHKVLHYGDVEEGVHSPPIESLPEKIPVADMKTLLVGKECPHTKEKSSGKQNKVSTSHSALRRGPSTLPSPAADGFWWWVAGGRLGGFTGGGRFLMWLETGDLLGLLGHRGGGWEAAPTLNPAGAGKSPAEKPATPCAVPPGRPGAGLLHRVRHGGILPQLHCPHPVRVLPLDGWAERAPGQGDDERANANGPRCPAVHGAQAAAPGPGEHQHSRHSPSHPKAPQQLKLLLRLQPRRAVSSSLCPSPPLHPPKSNPFLQALSFISAPKGRAQALAGGLGMCCLHLAHPGASCPPFPVCVLPSCEGTGLSHRVSGSCSRQGDLAALPPCQGQARRNTFQTAKPLCGGGDPPISQPGFG